jgi:hypothetical protein
MVIGSSLWSARSPASPQSYGAHRDHSPDHDRQEQVVDLKAITLVCVGEQGGNPGQCHQAGQADGHHHSD